MPAVGGGAYDPAQPGHHCRTGIWSAPSFPAAAISLNGMRFASDGYYKGGWKDRGVMPEPRVGFAYALTGDDRTILRGGFGMMHDRIQGNLIFNPVFTNPRNVVTPVVSNGNLANLASVTADSTPPLGSVVAAAPDGKVPTIYNYSIGVQRSLGWGTTIDVAYVGSVSHHLVTSRNLNQIPYLTAFSREAQDPSKYPDGVVPDIEPDLPQAYVDAGFNYSGNYAFDAPFLVPYRGFAPFIQYYKFDGNADYHSLQVSLQRRFSKGLTFGAAYTYSRSRTTANADEDAAGRVRHAEVRLSARLVGSSARAGVQLRLRHSESREEVRRAEVAAVLTDNFQLSGITTFESGAPIDTGLWWSPAMTINGTYNADAIGYSRAYVYPTISSDVEHEVGTSKFNPAAFTPPPVGPSAHAVARWAAHWRPSELGHVAVQELPARRRGRSLPAAPVRGVQRLQPPELQQREPELDGESAVGLGANER